MWSFIYEIFISIMLIILSILSIRGSNELVRKQAIIDELKREKAQLEKQAKEQKDNHEEEIRERLRTIKESTQIEAKVVERLEKREVAASVQPTSSPMPAFNRKKSTGRSTFNVTTGSNSARSGSTQQPSSFDPILYATITDDSDHRSHSHSHSSSHHHDSGSSSSHHSYDSGSSHSSYDSGSSSSYDSGSSSSYDSGSSSSFD